MTCEKGLGEVHNIGTGSQTSVKELAKMIGQASGGRWKEQLIDARPGEARETQADISKTTENLGWIPKKSLSEWIHEQYPLKVETSVEK